MESAGGVRMGLLVGLAHDPDVVQAVAGHGAAQHGVHLHGRAGRVELHPRDGKK